MPSCLTAILLLCHAHAYCPWLRVGKGAQKFQHVMHSDATLPPHAHAHLCSFTDGRLSPHRRTQVDLRVALVAVPLMAKSAVKSASSPSDILSGPGAAPSGCTVGAKEKSPPCPPSARVWARA